jgi:hypothetical protein
MPAVDVATVADVTGSVRVMIVDDDPVVRAALAMILGHAPGVDVVGEAADGATCCVPSGPGPAVSCRPGRYGLTLASPEHPTCQSDQHLGIGLAGQGGSAVSTSVQRGLVVLMASKLAGVRG